MTAPRLAPCSRTSQAMPGVGSTPARSARPPAEAMPAHSASSSMGPERRVSRPTTTTGRSAPALAREQRRGAAERERDLGAEHVAVGDAAHAVRSEQPASHGRVQRFENCGRRRAPLRPAFLRSTARASRVR